jgi:hypothetical protein
LLQITCGVLATTHAAKSPRTRGYDLDVAHAQAEVTLGSRYDQREVPVPRRRPLPRAVTQDLPFGQALPARVGVGSSANRGDGGLGSRREASATRPSSQGVITVPSRCADNKGSWTRQEPTPSAGTSCGKPSCGLHDEDVAGHIRGESPATLAFSCSNSTVCGRRADQF